MQKKISGALISVFYKDGLEPICKNVRTAWHKKFIQPAARKSLLRI
jgi:hypothetical protein